MNGSLLDIVAYGPCGTFCNFCGNNHSEYDYVEKDKKYHWRDFLNPIRENSKIYLENVKKYNSEDKSLQNLKSDVDKTEKLISRYKNLNFVDRIIFQVKENTPSRLQQELSSSKFLLSKGEKTKIMREEFITDAEKYLNTYELT